MGRFEGRFVHSRWGTASGIPGVPVAEDEKSKSPFDLKTLLAALSLIAYIIVQLSDKHPRASWVLLGLTVFLVVANTPLKQKIAEWIERRGDNAVARTAFPKFREFVHRFGPFIDSRFNDTLHAIVRTEIVQRRNDNNAAFNLPNMALFHGWWDYFWQRLDRQPRTMTEVRAALMEFHLLVASYTNYCVTPIFELSPNLKAEVTADAKSSLNAFQQRYERFLGEYMQFGKSLSESRPVLNGLPCWFSTPKPLT